MRINSLLLIFLCLAVPLSAEEFVDNTFERQEQYEDHHCLFESDTAPDMCENNWDIFSLYTILSHNEGRGIGYRQGYTTLEFFMMPSQWQDRDLYPFIDLRGHGLNNQRLAANAGVGIRTLVTAEWLIGANFYYDFRQGEHQGFDRVGHRFQQVSFGFEALGPIFDLRLNLYQPVGKKTSTFVQTYFFDNAGITPTNFTKQQFTAQGLDAEIGGNVGSGYIGDCKWKWNLYIAAGPYYLLAEDHTAQWGGKARLEAYLGRYIFLKATTSYDRVNRGTGQICLGINIPLYPFTSIKPAETACSPDDLDRCLKWRNWIAQPPERVEIMPLRTRRLPQAT